MGLVVLSDDMFGDNFSRNNRRRNARAWNGELASVIQVFDFFVLHARLQYGRLQQGVGQAISIALKGVVVAFEIGDTKTSFVNNMVFDIVSGQRFEALN
jgi:hypothetical protein